MTSNPSVEYPWSRLWALPRTEIACPTPKIPFHITYILAGLLYTVHSNPVAHPRSSDQLLQQGTTVNLYNLQRYVLFMKDGFYGDNNIFLASGLSARSVNSRSKDIYGIALFQRHRNLLMKGVQGIICKWPSLFWHSKIKLDTMCV